MVYRLARPSVTDALAPSPAADVHPAQEASTPVQVPLPALDGPARLAALEMALASQLSLAHRHHGDYIRYSLLAKLTSMLSVAQLRLQNPDAPVNFRRVMDFLVHMPRSAADYFPKLLLEHHNDTNAAVKTLHERLLAEVDAVALVCRNDRASRASSFATACHADIPSPVAMQVDE